MNMGVIRKIIDLKEPLEIDLQLMATELDTSVNDLRYISTIDLGDAIILERFSELCRDIEVSEGVEVTSFDDNTVLYEFLDEAVVIHDLLGIKFVIFDKDICQKIKIRLDSY